MDGTAKAYSDQSKGREKELYVTYGTNLRHLYKNKYNIEHLTTITTSNVSIARIIHEVLKFFAYNRARNGYISLANTYVSTN
jgi:hypothetical protein